MNTFQSNCFTSPLGVGSAILLYASSFKNGEQSLFTDNGTYYGLITLLIVYGFIYFIADLTLMLYKFITDYAKHKDYGVYFFHHAISLFALVYVPFYNYALVKYLLAYFTYELSTPFMNLSTDYYRAKIYDTKSKIVNLLFIVSYTLVRVIFGTYLLFNVSYLLFQLEGYIKFIALLPIGLQILIYWWYYKIVKLFNKLFIIPLITGIKNYGRPKKLE